MVCMHSSVFVFFVFPDSRLKVFASPGDTVTLPCRLNRDAGFSFGGMGNRIKWTKIEGNQNEDDVLVSMGFHKVKYGRYQNHAHLQEADENDASLIINNIQLDDFGTYKCEIINGMDENIAEVEIRMTGNLSWSISLFSIRKYGLGRLEM